MGCRLPIQVRGRSGRGSRGSTCASRANDEKGNRTRCRVVPDLLRCRSDGDGRARPIRRRQDCSRGHARAGTRRQPGSHRRVRRRRGAAMGANRSQAAPPAARGRLDHRRKDFPLSGPQEKNLRRSGHRGGRRDSGFTNICRWRSCACATAGQWNGWPRAATSSRFSATAASIRRWTRRAQRW